MEHQTSPKVDHFATGDTAANDESKSHEPAADEMQINRSKQTHAEQSHGNLHTTTRLDDNNNSVTTTKASQFVVDFFADSEQLAVALQPLLSVPSRELGPAIASLLHDQLGLFQYNPLQNVIVELLASELVWVRHQFAPDIVVKSCINKNDSHAQPINIVDMPPLPEVHALPATAPVSSINVAMQNSLFAVAEPSKDNSGGGGKRSTAQSKQQIKLPQTPVLVVANTSELTQRQSVTHEAVVNRHDTLSSSKALLAVLKAIKFLANNRASQIRNTKRSSSSLGAELVKAFIEENCFLHPHQINTSPTTVDQLLHHHIIHHLFRKFIYFFNLYDHLLADKFPVVCDQRELRIHTVNTASDSWILPLCEAIPVNMLHAIAHMDGALTAATPSTAEGGKQQQQQSDSGGQSADTAQPNEANLEVKLTDEFTIKIVTLRKLVCSALCEALSTFQINLRMTLKRREEKFIAAAKQYADEQQAKGLAQTR